MSYCKSDDLQWVSKKYDNIYDLIEVRLVSRDPDRYIYVTGTIDLRDYSDEEICDYISSYGYDSIDVCKEQYPIEWQQVIAECIFESLPEIELNSFGPYDSEDEAETEVLEYIDLINSVEKDAEIAITVYTDITPGPHKTEDLDDNLTYIRVQKSDLLEWFREYILPDFRGDDKSVSDEGLLDEWLDEYTADDTVGLYGYLKQNHLPVVIR